MTLQSSGAISANNINVELDKAGTTLFSVNAADIRELAGRSSGSISWSHFYGKSAGELFAIGVESINATTYGYKNTVVGTLSPATLHGAVIDQLSMQGGFGFSSTLISIDGTHPQNFFDKLIINQPESGTPITFHSTSAVYTNPIGKTTWKFTTGVNGDAWNSSRSTTVTIVTN